MELSKGEKLILIMLCEIYEHLKIKNGTDAKFVQEAIYSGNLWGLEWKFPGIFDQIEPDPEVITEVTSILEMWSVIEASYKQLSAGDKAQIEKEAAPAGKFVEFPGFDGNQEPWHLNVAVCLVQDLGRFAEFKSRDLNSHLPLLGGYKRMLVRFTPLLRSMGSGFLSVDDLIALLKEQIAPDYTE